MPKEVLLFSAGIDSFVSWHLLRKPECLYCAIGHKYQEQELQRVLACRDDLGMTVRVETRLSLQDWEDPVTSVVPLRNVLLASIAAQSANADVVWMGIPNGEAGAKCHDKSFDFRVLLSHLLSATLNRKVVVKSALEDLTKGEAVARYIELTGDKDCKVMQKYTVGCYFPAASGTKIHCGNCYACFKRWACFALNGVDNLSEYKKDPRQWEGIVPLENSMRRMLIENDFTRYSYRRMNETLKAIEIARG